MTPQFFTHFMMVPSLLADLRPIMRASYRQIHHHFSEQHAISASHEMRALIMINSGSRSPLARPWSCYSSSQNIFDRADEEVTCDDARDESTSPEEIKYPHLAHDNSSKHLCQHASFMQRF